MTNLERDMLIDEILESMETWDNKAILVFAQEHMFEILDNCSDEELIMEHKIQVCQN